MMSWDRGRVLLFRPSESRTEGGRRQVRVGPRLWHWAGDLAVVQGFCRLPCFVAAPGTVKSFHKNSPGSQHNNRITRFPAKPGGALIVNLSHVITAIPLNVRQGSGCYVGTRTLVEGLRRLGTRVIMVIERKIFILRGHRVMRSE